MRPFRGNSANLIIQEQRLRERCEREIADATERSRLAFSSTMKRLQDNRVAAAILAAEDFEVLTDSWWGEEGESLRIDLGDGIKEPARVASGLLQIARALQCHFEEGTED